MSVRLLAALLALATALAGCTADQESTPGTGGTTPTGATGPTTPTSNATAPTTPTGNGTTPGGSSQYDYRLIIEGVPPNATVGQPFTFSFNITGSPQTTSTHVGAHYDDNGTARPIASAMRSCDHTSGSAPSNTTVTCTIDTPGVWYVRGHYRVVDDQGQTEDLWSAPLRVEVQAN